LIPDLSVFVVIGLVLVLSVVLDRVLLRPVTRVMHEREAAIRSARELAQTSRARAQAAADELEAKTGEARAEVYRQMEEKRRAALERRASLVADTRREIERVAREAAERIKQQAQTARARLEREVDALAGTIVERVLGRKAS
jgi:F0F1-type ATP synthase membrane subunit b/b'